MNELILSLLLGVSPLTYNKEIRPILQNRCAVCHGANWPERNWLDYKSTYKNKDRIKLRLANKTMPPAGLTMLDNERELVLRWIKQGAKEK